MTKITLTDLPAFLGNYQDCFGEIGTLSSARHKTVNPSVPAVFNSPRKILFALKKRLKVELDRMTKIGVFKLVSEPTEWVNTHVIVEKPNGFLRIYLNLCNLNKAMKQEHF